MKNLSLTVIALLGLAVCVAAQGYRDVCEHRPEGWVVEIGCWGYYQCLNGTVEKIPCPAGTVLERDQLNCVKPGTGNTACGVDAICTGKSDGYYADVTYKCQSYFYCSGETNYGRLYCPGTLVWNETIGVCDWQYNVAPPCGFRLEP